MSDPPSKPHSSAHAKGAKPNAERLAQTLRANLRRRKDAARKLADKGVPDAADEPQRSGDSEKV